MEPAPAKRARRDGRALLEAYEAWLRRHGVWWDPRLRLRPPSDPSDPSDLSNPSAHASGWSLQCLEAIPKGLCVVRVPRAAAFSASAAPSVLASLRADGRSASVPMDCDSQLPLALALLHCRAEGEWSAKLRPEVTPTGVPLPWSLLAEAEAEAEEGRAPAAPASLLRAALCGTELEAVVAAKLQRLRAERRALNAPKDFARACGVVLSRVQPWWGGCLVPFVDMANHAWVGARLEFRRRGEAIHGYSLGLEPGEVLQSYGRLSTADAIYRYGMAPPRGACVPDVVTILAEQLEAACPPWARRRRAALERFGLLECSPWDGVEALGVELGARRGLRLLLATATMLLASEEAWAAASVAGPERLCELLPGVAWKPMRSFDWAKILPKGCDWAPAAAVQVVLEALRLRARCYDSEPGVCRSIAERCQEAARHPGSLSSSCEFSMATRDLLHLREAELQILLKAETQLMHISHE